jgi:hypothetical protein
LLFHTLREPPRKGSLRESILLLYVLKKEEIEYTRDLALAQIQLDKDKGLERFNEYRKNMFPWVETAKKRDDDAHKKLLEEVVKRGPISIRAMHQPKLRSRLVQRVEKHQASKVTKEVLQQQNDLYRRLGKTVPV